jgi:tRNA 2-selenouridine synthase
MSMAKNHPVLDVRSPGEYQQAHFPGATSLPLFTDEERKIVGTAYKQQSREVAIKIGLDFFGPKMKTMIEAVEKMMGADPNDIHANAKGKTILVYCWRGGMRSAGVAWLLDLYGFKVCTLWGGYKKFRNHVLEIFKQPFAFHIVGGYTGSGKTPLLNELGKLGENIVDLESLANHKGSAFGNIGMPPQPRQEMFENLVAMALIEKSRGKANPVIWLEDESQRIGDLNVPHSLWETMRRSPVYFLDIPFEERLKYIVTEYGALDPERLESAIRRIEKRLGGMETKNAIEHLQGNNTIECFRILLKYYDKWYLKSLHNRENIHTLLHTVSCKKVDPANANILIQQVVPT